MKASELIKILPVSEGFAFVSTISYTNLKLKLYKFKQKVTS